MAQGSETRAPRSPLGLRGRLALFFIAITVIPLLIAFIVLSDQVIDNRSAMRQDALQRSTTALETVFQDRSTALGAVAGNLAESVGPQLREGDDAAVLEGITAAELPERADFVVAVDAEGDTVAELLREPEVAEGAEYPTLEEVGEAALLNRGTAGAIVGGRRLLDAEGAPFAVIAAGQWVDETTLAALPAPARNGGLATLAGQQVWAATSSSGTTIDPTTIVEDEEGALRAATTDGQAVSVLRVPGVRAGGAEAIVWVPYTERAEGIASLAALILGPATLVAALAGWLLAGTVVEPVERAARAAEAISGGRLEVEIPLGGGGRELDDLALALNAMSEQLQSRVAELERSRDELRGSLSRLGETLSSSLDLDRTLAVVTETAMDTLSADRALLMLFTPERDALYAKVGRGVGDGLPRLRPGQGRLGWVAARSIPVLVTDERTRNPADAPPTDPPSGGPGAGRAGLAALPDPAVDEPISERQLLVPLVGRGETLGVLSLFRDAPGTGDYGERDLETLRSFAAQAAVALENVLLHEEAQRRSVTDPLTELWNFRHFEAQAAREMESAIRFDRPLSLLVLDVDRFKDVNDRLGHQAGDDVLRELARRIRDSARAPDLVARYGGEEFVVLLPGADSEGARISAERMRRRLAGTPYPLSSGESVTVTSSIGVASFPEHAADVGGLLRRADDALYAAKNAGRNRVVVSHMELRDQTSA